MNYTTTVPPNHYSIALSHSSPAPCTSYCWWHNNGDSDHWTAPQTEFGRAILQGFLNQCDCGKLSLIHTTRFNVRLCWILVYNMQLMLFFSSLYLLWAQVPPSHGVHVDPRKVCWDTFNANQLQDVFSITFCVMYVLQSSEPISTSQPVSQANNLDVSSGPDALWLRSHSGEPIQTPEVQGSPPPPPPPPKRHCRSLSVPEDLPRCRSSWHPTASKVWTPVRRDSRSGRASSSSSAASSLPFFGPSSSFTSSSLHSSSSPTFFSLALSSDSLLPWSFQWDSCNKLKGGCSTSIASPSSCSCSPAPQLQRRFSLSPVHIQDASSTLLWPQSSPASAAAAATAHAGWCGWGGAAHPTLPPSPTSACSTPSTSRRDLHPALPRCHSQPCDLRRPRLKRRHDADVLPCPRPGLDFSKMTQVGIKVMRIVVLGSWHYSLFCHPVTGSTSWHVMQLFNLLSFHFTSISLL